MVSAMSPVFFNIVSYVREVNLFRAGELVLLAQRRGGVGGGRVGKRRGEGRRGGEGREGGGKGREGGGKGGGREGRGEGREGRGGGGKGVKRGG